MVPWNNSYSYRLSKEDFRARLRRCAAGTRPRRNLNQPVPPLNQNVCIWSRDCGKNSTREAVFLTMRSEALAPSWRHCTEDPVASSFTLRTMGRNSKSPYLGIGVAENEIWRYSATT